MGNKNRGKICVDNWKATKAGTIAVDWTGVENILGFQIHENLKDFYSRILAENKNIGMIDGIMKFNPGKFVKEYVNKENWLEDANGGREFCGLSLYLLGENSNEYVCQFFKNAFFGDWTGGNNLGHRAYIGEILLNIGQISLIFNNNTGKFEWVDIGYGYYDVYEENPYGIIADSAQEFLDKIELVEIP